MIRNYLHIIIILLLSIAPLCAEVEVKSYVDPAESSVGVEAVYTVQVLTDKDETSDYTITLPEEKKYQEEDDKVPLYIIRSTDKSSEEVEGKLIQTYHLKMVFLQIGEQELPLLRITGKDGVDIGYKAPSIKITELNKEGKPEDIEPPYGRSGNYLRLILLIAALVIVIVLIVLLVRFLKKRPKKETVVVKRPGEIFFEEYNALCKKNYLEDNEIEQFCTSLSMIFRRYLSGIYGITAVDLTTDEIFEKLRNNVRSQNRAETVRTIMQLWDLAKFAELRPSVEIINTNVDEALELVKAIEKEAGYGL